MLEKWIGESIFLRIYCKLLLLLIYFDEIFTYVDIFAWIITNVITLTFSWTVTSLQELLLNCRNRFSFAKRFTYFQDLLQIFMICYRFAQNCLQIESGTVKGAIPVLSYSSAAVCLALNCILPGVGQLALLHMMSGDLGWKENVVLIKCHQKNATTFGLRLCLWRWQTVSRTGFLLYEDDMKFSVKALDILCYHVSHLFGVLVIISDEYWARFRHIFYFILYCCRWSYLRVMCS
jgi:hypothetical protein